MIYGIGVDLVKVARIERVLGRYGDRFCARVFTEREIAYCRGKSWAAAGFAMRFAAKEAFSKALGVGLRKGGIRWREVEVIPNPLGKPEIFVSGRAAPTLRRGRHHRHAPLPHRRRRPRPGGGDFGAVRVLVGGPVSPGPAQPPGAASVGKAYPLSMRGRGDSALGAQQ